MAVTIAGTPIAQAGTPNAGSVTFQWNNSASANYAVFGVSSWDANAAEALVSTVTYAAVSAGSIGARQDAGNDAISLWGIANPAAGSNDVVVTMGGSCSEFIVGAIGFAGVNLASPVGTFVGADGSGVNNASTGAISSETDAIVLAIGYFNADPTSAQTQQWEVNAFTTTWGVGATAAGAGSVTMNWTHASTGWIVGGLSIRPEGVSAPIVHQNTNELLRAFNMMMGRR